MLEIVKSIDGQEFSAIYIVGDLHGCHSLLIRELKNLILTLEMIYLFVLVTL